MAYNTLSPRPYLSRNGVNYDLQYDTTNGKVQLIQQNAPTGTVPIYSDGKWGSTVNSLGINSTEQQTIHNNIQVAVRSAYTTAGGSTNGNILPPFAAASQQGQPPGQSTITPANAINQNASSPDNQNSGLGALLDLDKTLSQLNQGYGVNNSYELFKGEMKYPLDLKSNSQDTLIITAYEYVPSGQSLLSGTIESIIQNGILRGVDRLEKPIGTVFLPMPNGIAEGKEVSWGPDSLNTLNAGVLNDVVKNPGLYAGASAISALVGGGVSKFTNPQGGVGNIASGAASGAAKGVELTALGRALGSALGSAEGTGLVATAAVERILALSQFQVPAETILSRTAGLVPNQNLELLFGGPSLRSFSVSYRLTARSEDEAKMIRKIIRFFKQTMSPRKKTGAAGQASVFLSTPNVYSIRFTTVNNADIEGISRFKTCALTSFQTDYTPDGQWMAYDKGQPISTRITMAFTELEPIYDTDYQSNVTSGRADLTPITDTSVGY